MTTLFDRHPRIWVDPARMSGQPCIRGTRIPASMVVRYLAMGETLDGVLEAYPSLTPEDVRAAQAFAADYLGNTFALAAE